MAKKDYLLALLVVIIWGANFTFVKLGLEGVPSMLLVSIRYTLVIFPAIFFIKKPQTSWFNILAYGLTVGVGQFACLFYALEIGMPAGLSSIIVQIHSFISAWFSHLVFKEEFGKKQVLGFLVAALGLVLIGLVSTNQGLDSIPLAAISFTLGAAFFWALSNLVSKKASEEAKKEDVELNTLALVIWAGLVPPLPMLGLSYLVHGPQAISVALANLRPMSIISVFYLAYGATIFGYGAWNTLLNRYPIGKVAPLALLVPVVALLVSQLVLGERLLGLQWLGVVIILLGLIISNLSFKEKTNEYLEEEL